MSVIIIAIDCIDVQQITLHMYWACQKLCDMKFCCVNKVYTFILIGFSNHSQRVGFCLGFLPPELAVVVNPRTVLVTEPRLYPRSLNVVDAAARFVRSSCPNCEYSVTTISTILLAAPVSLKMLLDRLSTIMGMEQLFYF